MQELAEEDGEEPVDEQAAPKKHKRVEHATIVGSEEHLAKIAHDAAVTAGAAATRASAAEGKAAKKDAAESKKAGAKAVAASLKAQRAAKAKAVGGKKRPTKKKQTPCPVDAEELACRCRYGTPTHSSCTLPRSPPAPPAPRRDPSDPPRDPRRRVCDG